MAFGRSRGRGFRAAGPSGRGSGGGFNKPGRMGRNFDHGPPDRIILLGHFIYTCQNDIVCKVDIDDVPYFNAPIFLENKEQVGKIDEIFGTVRDYSVSIQLSENVYASSFMSNQKLFIDPGKLLPISRFLPKPPQPKGIKKKCSSGGGFMAKGASRAGGMGNRGGRNNFGSGFKGRGGRGGAFSKGNGPGGRGRW